MLEPFLNGTQRETRISQHVLEATFRSLVEDYVAPWVPLRSSDRDEPLSKPITKKLLDSVELILRDGAFRVRLPETVQCATASPSTGSRPTASIA